MEYTIDGVEHIGIKRLTRPEDVNEGIVVIAWFDGEPDLWVVNIDDGGLEVLKKLYSDEWGPDRVTYTVLGGNRANHEVG
jgi:hypothetical protein